MLPDLWWLIGCLSATVSFILDHLYNISLCNTHREESTFECLLAECSIQRMRLHCPYAEPRVRPGARRAPPEDEAALSKPLSISTFFFFFPPLPWVTISFQFNAGLNYSCQSPINPAAIQSLSREGGWGGEVPRRGESCLPPGPLIGPSSERPRPPCTQADGLKRLSPPKEALKEILKWSGDRK